MDIVERLLDHAYITDYAPASEAADEITKLRAELAEAKKAMEFNYEQYQDVSRMLCEVQDELAELKQRSAWEKSCTTNE